MLYSSNSKHGRPSPLGKVKETLIWTLAPSASRARHLPPGGRLKLHCVGNNPSVKIEDFATSLYTREAKVTLHWERVVARLRVAPTTIVNKCKTQSARLGIYLWVRTHAVRPYGWVYFVCCIIAVRYGFGYIWE